MINTFMLTGEFCLNGWKPATNSIRRQTPSHPAGFVLDACIHFLAILRFLLGASGEKLEITSAYTRQLSPALPPMDSVFAILQTEKGVSGTFTFSVGVPHTDSIEYDIFTDKGTIKVQGPTSVVTELHNDGKVLREELKDEFTFGVPEEFAAFASALTGSSLDSRVSVEEAFADLKVLDALLKSGQQSGHSVQIQ
jgi:predicted dehydrogenase